MLGTIWVDNEEHYENTFFNLEALSPISIMLQPVYADACKMHAFQRYEPPTVRASMSYGVQNGRLGA